MMNDLKNTRALTQLGEKNEIFGYSSCVSCLACFE